MAVSMLGTRQAASRSAPQPPSPRSPGSRPGSRFRFNAKIHGRLAASFSFGAAGDLGADSSTTATLDALAGAETSFFLAIGDLSYHQITPESAWCSYVKQHVGATYPFEILAGNHEEKADEPGRLYRELCGLPARPAGRHRTYAHQYYFDYPPEAPLPASS